jgi:hypothetical protein
MIRFLALVAMALPQARGQTLTDAAQAQTMLARAGRAAIPCAVSALQPALTLSLRLQSGYTFRAPDGEPVTVVLRVTPDGGVPVFLTDRVVPAGEAAGVFYLGEGHYRFHWVLLDEAGRACVRDWELDAPARGAKLAIAPGAVTDLSLHGVPVRPPAPGPARLTILFEAAPILAKGGALEEPAAWNTDERMIDRRADLTRAPSAVALRPGDQTVLLGALSAVAEEFAASEIRLVAFSLAQQKEIVRREGFSLAALPDVAAALRATQFATVDYHVLLNPAGHHDLLARLINEELRDPAGAVLFLGPHEFFRDDFPAGLLDRKRGAAPAFFRLAYEHPAAAPTSGRNAITLTGADVADDPTAERALRRSAAVVTTTRPEGVADPVAAAVRKLGGRSFSIQQPREFARAVAEIRRSLGRLQK